jgi:hypothetical protein
MTQLPPAAPNADAPAPRGRGCASWVIGCGATLAILLVLGGAAAWWFVGRPLLQVYGAIQDVQSIDRLDDRVRNRAAFTPPADGVLSEAQVLRFLDVQQGMGDAVTGRLDRMQARFDQLEGRDFAWRDALGLAGAYTDFFRLLVDTKESQIAALDAAGFSAAEYAWVRREVLRAAGLDASADLGAFVGALTGGEDAAPRAQPAAAPQANRDLVERYRERLDETVFLAVIGL